MNNWQALKDVVASEVVVPIQEHITAADLLRMMIIAENTVEREEAPSDENI